MDEHGQAFMDALPKKGRILDLGAGQGYWAEDFLERGHDVVAVDRRRGVVPGVEWHTADAVEWLARGPQARPFDGVFLRNLLHFIPKDRVVNELVPALARRLAPGAVIGIMTFYDRPRQPFRLPIVSFWTVDELHAFCARCGARDTLHAKQYERYAPSLDGRKRHFRLSEIVAR